MARGSRASLAATVSAVVLTRQACGQVNETLWHGREGTGPDEIVGSGNNCTWQRCDNARNLCGDYSLPCHAVARIPQGPQIWTSVHFRFMQADRYLREEKASLSKEACEAGRSFMQIRYEGDFQQRGGSPEKLGYSLAQVDVTNSWVTLVTDETCLQVEEYSYTDKCLNVYEAITELCPCNGWEWATNGAPRVRNLGAFCGQPEQCPILHEVFLSKPHYYTFAAWDNQACFGRTALSREVGWSSPIEDGCFAKQERGSFCGNVALSAGSRSAYVPWLGPVGLLLMLRRTI